MTDIITKTQMQVLLDNFMQVHVDGKRDHIGPNAGDAPFFRSLHETIDEAEFAEAAHRLQTYRNTQLPGLLKSIGVDPKEGQHFLDTLTKQGEQASAYRSTLRSIKAKADDAARRGDNVDEFMAQVSDLIGQLFSNDGAPRIMQREGTPDFEAIYTAAAERQAEMKRRDEEFARLQRTVKCEVYEDVWYGRNDYNKRYPKKSNRILMRFPYDESFLPFFKQALVGQGRCIWKPEHKAWSLKMDAELILRAAEVFEQHGYFADQLRAINAPTETRTPTDNTVSATVEAETMVLKWPWLNDDDLRTRVMAIVKGVMGRKWDGSRKAWLVPVSQAAFLKGRLDGVYQPLADAIAALPSLRSVVANTAERIAISSAASLADEDTIADMRERLSEVFPPGRSLYPFQYVGVRFAELADGKALIGDDMGVGKTIQALAYAALHPEHHPVLVVCPANVKFNWLKESQAWLSTYTTEVIRSGKDAVPDTDVVVINYDLMSKQRDALLERGFRTVIFDESHYLKNYKAQRTQASLEVAKQADSILALSGTAITNRPSEFFTTLNLLRPVEFGNFFAYGKRYCAAYNNGWGWDFSGSSNEAELHERTRSVAIRRLKKEVMDELPDKIRQIVDTFPAPKAMKEYRDEANRWLSEYEYHKANNSMPAGFVLNMLTSLRHHAGRMKTDATADWAMDYRNTTGKPLIIFTHHRDVQEMVSDAITALATKQKESITIDYINGNVSAEHRQAAVERFQAGKTDFLICSTVAAKEGLTLTAADTVVFVEREWVPGWEEQAEDRVNRIGQDAETVHAVYLSVSGTIDEKFNAVVEEKRATVSAILDGGEMGKRDGIAKALLKAMVDAGDLPKTMLGDLGVSA